MKNVYLVDEQVSSKTNGIGPFLKAYISCLKSMNVNITLLSFNADVDEFDIKMVNGIRTFLFPIFPTGNFTFHAQIVNRFIKLYIEDSVDNIFCFNHSPCKDLLQTVRTSFPLSKLLFTIHDMGWTKMLNGDYDQIRKIIANRYKKSVQKKYRGLLSFFDQEKEMYNIVDGVICLSRSTYDVLKDVYRIPENKIEIIYSGLKTSKMLISEKHKILIRKGKHIQPNEKLLLYVGRLSRPKGVYALLDAFSGILTMYPDTRLILAGSANSEWKKFFSSVRDISSKITITGFISKKELKQWYQIADIGVIPSYYEQCPYVGMEMMTYGMPIIASDASGLKDMFTSGVNAEVACIGDQRNEKEFSDNIQGAIRKLLDSEKLRTKIGMQAKRTFVSTYSLHCMSKRYKCLFEKIFL